MEATARVVGHASSKGTESVCSAPAPARYDDCRRANGLAAERRRIGVTGCSGLLVSARRCWARAAVTLSMRLGNTMAGDLAQIAEHTLKIKLG
jgi:hypothetical protein